MSTFGSQSSRDWYQGHIRRTETTESASRVNLSPGSQADEPEWQISGACGSVVARTHSKSSGQGARRVH
jgi:hypothetical protein